MTTSRDHSKLVNDILRTFSKGAFRFWRNETGVAINPRGVGLIRYGLPGSSDILGIGPGGRFLAIEVKTGFAGLEPRQINFRDMIRSYGGEFHLARSLDDVKSFLDGIVHDYLDSRLDSLEPADGE